MKHLIVSAAILAAAGLPARAQTVPYAPYRWHTLATHGMGTVTGMVISPVPPFDVYVKTDVGGAYRYDRRQDNWVPLLDAVGLGGPPLDGDGAGVGVESIAVDPANPAVAYAVVQYASGQTGSPPYTQYTETGEVLRTGDRGATWHPTGLAPHLVGINPNGDYRSSTGERLAVDPLHPNTLLFASRVNGLWRKQGSADWQQVGGGLPDPTSLPNYFLNGTPDLNQPGFTFVAFAPAPADAGETIYVGVTGSGIWASRDGGAGWANLGGPTDSDRAAVAADGTLYVGARSGLQKLNGAAWTAVSPIPGAEFNGVAADPASAGTIMAVSNNLVFRSLDGGASWSQQRLFMGSDDPLAQTPVNPSAPDYYLDFASNYASQVAIDPAQPKAA